MVGTPRGHQLVGRPALLAAGGLPDRGLSTGRKVGSETRRGEHGQALVEAAMVIPLLLLLAFGVVGVGRINQAQLGVSAVAREAARVASHQGDPYNALAKASATGQEVAAEYYLTNGSLQVSVDVGDFARGGQVRTAARYVVALADLPLLGAVDVPVESHHAERLDPNRSRWSGL